jgi:hypothetical protein
MTIDMNGGPDEAGIVTLSLAEEFLGIGKIGEKDDSFSPVLKRWQETKGGEIPRLPHQLTCFNCQPLYSGSSHPWL